MPAMTVTDVGLNAYRDANKGTAAIKVLYLALGDGSTALSTGDTTLASEKWRKIATTYANGASPGASVISVYVGPDEAVGVDISELGWFIGNATTLANSGTLLARALFTPHVKTNSESYTFQLDLSNIRG